MSICPNCGHDLENDAVWGRDGFVLDSRGTLAFEGRLIAIRPSGAKILQLLVAAEGRAVSSTTLASVFPDSANVAHLRVQIKYLRNALLDSGAPDIIRTHPHFGYSWGLAALARQAALESAGEPINIQISDEQWATLKPLLQSARKREGSFLNNSRSFLEAVTHVMSNGALWSDLPDRFGKWNSVYVRFQRWGQQGIWDHILPTLVDLRLTDNWKPLGGAPAADGRDSRKLGKADRLRNLLVDRAASLRASALTKDDVGESS